MPNPAPVIVVDPGPVAQRRKLLAALVGSLAVFVLAVNVPGSDVKSALVVLIPSVVAAVLMYFTENTPGAPSSKFLVTLGGAVVTLVVFLIQNGTEDWRSALFVFLAAILGAAGTWLTPNAGQMFVDAIPANATPHPDAA